MKHAFWIFCVLVNAILGDCMGIDFLNAKADDCKQFGEQVKTGAVDGDAMIAPLSAVKNMSTISNGDAVTIIRNLSIAAYYVPTERTDFQSLCGEALLHAAKYITTPNGGSPNFKILYALYVSQVDSLAKFNNDVRVDIIENMIGRFDSLVNGDVKLASDMRSTFYGLLKKSSAFSLYAI